MPDTLSIFPEKLFDRLSAKRQSGQHKGDFGHALMIGGSASMPGSIILILIYVA